MQKWHNLSNKLTFTIRPQFLFFFPFFVSAVWLWTHLFWEMSCSTAALHFRWQLSRGVKGFLHKGPYCEKKNAAIMIVRHLGSFFFSFSLCNKMQSSWTYKSHWVCIYLIIYFPNSYIGFPTFQPFWIILGLSCIQIQFGLFLFFATHCQNCKCRSSR